MQPILTPADVSRDDRDDGSQCLQLLVAWFVAPPTDMMIVLITITGGVEDLVEHTVKHRLPAQQTLHEAS